MRMRCCSQATVILGFELSSSKRYRKALVAVIAAPAVTAALNLLSLSGWYALPGFDLTTLGFALSALLLNDGVLRFGLLEVTPAIRNRVVEQLIDGVVVIQKDGRIIDLNPAAAATFGIPIDSSLNQPATNFIKTPLLPGLLVGLFSNAEITIGEPFVSRARDATVERHRTPEGNGAGAPRHHRTHQDQAGDGAPRAYRLPDRPRQSSLLHAAARTKRPNASSAAINR